jgi:hypothetical protein
MEHPEQTVGTDDLQKALEQLVKVADAEDVVAEMRKGGGVNYDTSGFSDESGKSGGGVTTETGSLESMLIGKMGELGLNALQAGGLIGMMKEKGFLESNRPAPKKMSGKKKGDDEGDDDDEGEEGEEMTAYARGYMDAMNKKGDDTEKSEDSADDDEESESFSKSFREDKDIDQAVDASPFLEALTARTTEALDGLHKSIKAGRADQGNINKALASALYQTGKLVKSQSRVIDELGKRLGMVESQPAPAKGATNPARAAALTKSFGAGGESAMSLSKSELVNTLSYLRFEKGMDRIEGMPIGELAVFAESGGEIRKDVLDFVTKYVSTHPNEREQAFRYQ